MSQLHGSLFFFCSLADKKKISYTIRLLFRNVILQSKALLPNTDAVIAYLIKCLL